MAPRSEEKKLLWGLLIVSVRVFRFGNNRYYVHPPMFMTPSIAYDKLRKSLVNAIIVIIE